MPESSLRTHIPQPLFAPIVRGLAQALFRWLGGLVVIGAENVPASGAVLICPNHLSNSDSLAVFAALPRRDIHFVANQELFDVPLLGAGMRAFGTVPIHRQSADRAAIRQAVGILAEGSTLVLFPEGHLSESGTLNPLLPGAALIALRAQAELSVAGGAPLTIVPVGLTRTNNFLPYGQALPQRSRLPARVAFGRPICLGTIPGSKSGPNQTAKLIKAIEADIRRLIGQELP